MINVHSMIPEDQKNMTMFFEAPITLTLHLRFRHQMQLVQSVLCENLFAIY